MAALRAVACDRLRRTIDTATAYTELGACEDNAGEQSGLGGAKPLSQVLSVNRSCP